MDWHEPMVFLHIMGAFLFAFGHGVSGLMAFKLRNERDYVRIGAILDLSVYSQAPMGVGLLVLLLTGIAAGFIENYWGTWWIWISIVLLIVVGGLMTPLGGVHYAKVRHGIGQRAPGDKKDAPLPEPVSPVELEPLLTANTPWVVSGVGGIGFALIVYLMVFKPF